MSNNSFKHLEKLAEIVTSIDDNKSANPEKIPALIAAGVQIVEDMKMDLLDIGELGALFSFLQPNCQTTLPRFIEEAHAEIGYLLGSQAYRVYYRETV